MNIMCVLVRKPLLNAWHGEIKKYSMYVIVLKKTSENTGSFLIVLFAILSKMQKLSLMFKKSAKASICIIF